MARMPHDLPLARKLLREEAEAFAAGLRLGQTKSRTWKKARYRRLAKLNKLLYELSPRTELIERWVDELHAFTDEMARIARAVPGSKSAPTTAPVANSPFSTPRRRSSLRRMNSPRWRRSCASGASPFRKSAGSWPRAICGWWSHRQALPQPRPALRRPDPGRQPRPDAGRGQVRTSPAASSSAPTPPGGFARASRGPSPTTPAPCACRATRSALWPRMERVRGELSAGTGREPTRRGDRAGPRRDGRGDASRCASWPPSGQPARTARRRRRTGPRGFPRRPPASESRASRSISTCCASASPRCCGR